MFMIYIHQQLLIRGHGQILYDTQTEIHREAVPS